MWPYVIIAWLVSVLLSSGFTGYKVYQYYDRTNEIKVLKANNKILTQQYNYYKSATENANKLSALSDTKLELSNKVVMELQSEVEKLNAAANDPVCVDANFLRQLNRIR